MIKPIIALCCNGLLLIACSQVSSDVNFTPPNESQAASKGDKPRMNNKAKVKSTEDNYGYANPEELEAMKLLASFTFQDYPYIAIVKDVEITYPEWPFGNPVDTDGFVSGIRRYRVELIEALRGDLPEVFYYEIYGEAQKFPIRKRPYPLAFCYGKQAKSFLTTEIEGQMFDNPSFVKLFLDEWNNAKPVEFANHFC